MYRRIERSEKSVGGLATRVDSLAAQLERIERAKSKRRETMSKLLENITEVSYVYIQYMGAARGRPPVRRKKLSNVLGSLPVYAQFPHLNQTYG